ncbi:MAG: peptidylprolyl isomerase, partial [Brevundimonas sp.]|nr:peptidylprolyl isomerase [Brevundimonas sp.]
MGLMRFTTGVALAALIAGSAIAQTASTSPTAGMQDPAAGSTGPVAAAAARPEFKMADGIVATVNDQVITGFDLRQRMLSVIAMSQVQPTEENLPAIQQQALQSLIEERLQAQEIANYETLVVSDEEVNREIAEMAREAGTTPENYLAFLEQGGIRPAALRAQLRTEIGWRELVGGRFNSRSRVSRAQVEQALRQLNEAAAKPQYLVGEIYLEANRVGGQQAALNGAEQLVQQMIQGAPFQNVARQFSAAPSAVRGGDAGWIVQGTVQPALQAALEVLEVGQLSRPIPVEGGVYIVYMRDKRSGAATSLVTLKQAMIELPEAAGEAEVAAASARLEGLRSSLTCDNILQRATSEAGLLGSDLGESDVADLAPQFQQVARTAEVNTISSPVRTPLGLHVLAVCGRRVGGADVPSYREVEGRLQNQNLAMLA